MDLLQRELAALPSLADEQLREKIEEMEALGRHMFPAMRRMAKLVLISARGELERRQTPSPTPKVESLDPKPVVASAATPAAPAPRPAPHVETPDLIRKLISPCGPDQVEAVVRRLCERLDPEFEGCYRACCRQVLAGELNIGVMIGGFHWARNAPAHGRKKGPSFAAYVAHQRETRPAPRPAQHRRE